MLTLSRALRVQAGDTVALVGAGGKTTAMFQLARELAPVLVTTTTHLGTWQPPLADVHKIWIDAAGAAESPYLPVEGITLVTGPREPATERYLGLSETQLSHLHAISASHGLPIIIEADGARQRAIKAPAGHEPCIPKFADLVIVVAGMSGIGQPLDAAHVHRPESFAHLAGLSTGETISPDALVQALTHPEGGLKNVPAGARRAVILTQATTPGLQSQASRMAGPLLASFQVVVIADLEKPVVHAVHQKVAGIVLAAGESRRYGGTKQLLVFKGQPFVRAVAQKALDAGLDPVIVVTGSRAEMVERALQGLPVQIARNEAWMSGQASSIRKGLLSLSEGSFDNALAGSSQVGKPAKAGAAIFLLADQPQVSVEVLEALVASHRKGLPSVLAPLVEERRANPTLFDQVTFADLLRLEGDQGGRALFSKYSPQYLPWMDPGLLSDVDTPEDYDRLLQRG